MFLTMISFIFVLGILVFIHELGHFLVAKKVGIKVEKFSLGFPPNIFARKYGETTYCIGVIPLGGYVKMAGENPDEERTGDPREFMSKSVGQRAAVIFAGPFMNYVLAILVLVGVFYFSGTPIFDKSRVIVGEVSKDGPALAAGLAVDDQIIGIDGYTVESFDSLRARIQVVVNQDVSLTWVTPAEDTVTKMITTKATPVPTPEGGIDTIGIIGFSQKPIAYESYGVIEATSRGFVTAHIIVWETMKIVKNLLFGQMSLKMIGGPVFIAQQSGKEARKGGTSLFMFLALLSVNLAVLNVLPIPVLDGGHLVFLAAEKIKGSPLSTRTRVVAQQIGLVILLGLVVLVTYNDILRILKIS